MDQVTQNARFSIEAFKEPRGFIKIISFILAIFAFATLSSHETSSKYTVMCNGGKDNQTREFKYGYHYALSSVELAKVPVCSNDTVTKTPVYLSGDFSSSSQFFCFIGVMGFLMSLASIVIYAFYDEMYMTTDLLPKVDFVLLVVWTLLWLISSSAWADGLNHVKYYTDPGNSWFVDSVPECKPENNKCVVLETGNFANANVSVMFGFLCMFVWGGSVWFVMKETGWFKERFGGQPQQQQATPPANQPSTSQAGPYPAYPSRM